MNIEDYNRYYLLFISYSILGIPYWLFSIGYSLVAIPYWVFPIGYSLLPTDCLLPRRIWVQDKGPRHKELLGHSLQDLQILGTRAMVPGPHPSWLNICASRANNSTKKTIQSPDRLYKDPKILYKDQKH